MAGHDTPEIIETVSAVAGTVLFAAFVAGVHELDTD